MKSSRHPEPQGAEKPIDEALRLSELHQYQVLDTDEEVLFDELTELASQICQTPIALISLIDEDRQWFKSHLGLEIRETKRNLAFCAHAILQDEVMEVADARQDPRFAQNPLVTGEPYIRFYAGAPLISPDGYKLGTLCVISDESKALSVSQKKTLQTLAKSVMSHLELKRRNLDLARQSQIRNDFLSYVSHEVKTPLNAINTFSRLLLEEAKTDGAPGFVLDSLGHINRSGERLLEVVNSILDLRQIEAGVIKLSPRNTYTRDLFEHLFSLAKVRCEDKQVRFSYRLSRTLPPTLYLDDTKYGQIALNLLSNAIKFTPSGKDVTCEVKWHNNTLRLLVMDKGPGIKEVDKQRLFKPFTRLDSTHHLEGTGLGMTISKALIDLMRGTIRIDSKPGVGSVVEVSIPLGQQAPGSFGTSAEVTQKTTVPGSILLVEDNSINQAVMQALLTPFGYRVTTVDSGEHAVEICQQQPFGLVLMDIHLPGISGLEASRRIILQQPELAIVALTADSLADPREMHLAGISEILTKPVDKHKLATVLNTYLSPQRVP